MSKFPRQRYLRVLTHLPTFYLTTLSTWPRSTPVLVSPDSIHRPDYPKSAPFGQTLELCTVVGILTNYAWSVWKQ